VADTRKAGRKVGRKRSSAPAFGGCGLVFGGIGMDAHTVRECRAMGRVAAASGETRGRRCFVPGMSQAEAAALAGLLGYS
jgi:hypothetical protein